MFKEHNCCIDGDVSEKIYNFIYNSTMKEQESI